MGEILFLYITQPEEICQTKKCFEWVLLFPDGFSGCKIFISIATFPIRMKAYQHYQRHNKLHFGGEVPGVSKYVQKGHLLTDMCKEEQMQ